MNYAEEARRLSGGIAELEPAIESALRTAYQRGSSSGEEEAFVAREEARVNEQCFMTMKDRYAEVARALGFKGDAWFGDPLVSHEEIVKRARELGGAS